MNKGVAHLGQEDRMSLKRIYLIFEFCRVLLRERQESGKNMSSKAGRPSVVRSTPLSVGQADTK